MLRSTIGRELLTRQDSEQDGCVPILTHLASEPASRADREKHHTRAKSNSWNISIKTHPINPEPGPNYSPT